VKRIAADSQVPPEELASRAANVLEDMQRFCARRPKVAPYPWSTLRAGVPPPHNVNDLTDLAEELWVSFRGSHTTRQEIALAAKLLDAAMFCSNHTLAIQVHNPAPKVLNVDAAEYHSLFNETFGKWSLSMMLRCHGIKQANFFYRLGVGPVSAHSMACSYYKRLVARVSRWLRRGTCSQLRQSLQDRAVHLFLTYLHCRAKLMGYMSSRGSTADLEALTHFLWRVRPNLSRHDPVGIVLALSYLNECLVFSPYTHLRSMSDADEGSLSEMSRKLGGSDHSLIDGFIAEESLWSHLGLHHYAASVRGAAVRWGRMWGASRDEARALILSGQLDGAAWTSSLWKRERLIADPKTYLHAAAERQESSSDTGCESPADKCEALAPYERIAEIAELHIPARSFAMSGAIDRGTSREALKLALGEHAELCLSGPWVSTQALTGGVQETLAMCRQILVDGFYESLTTQDEWELPTAPDEIAWEGGIDTIRGWLHKRRLVEGISHLRSEQLLSREALDALLEATCDSLKHHGIDVLYLGFFASGVGALLARAVDDYRNPEHILLSEATRYDVAVYISRAWGRMAGIDGDDDSQGLNPYSDAVAIVRRLLQRLEGLPLGARTAVLASPPLHYLPLVSLLNTRPGISDDHWVVGLSSIIPCRQTAAKRDFKSSKGAQTFAACGLSEFADVTEEMDWGQIGLSGIPIVDPTAEDLRKTMLSAADVVHISTHGFFERVHPIFSGVVARPARSVKQEYEPVFNAEFLGQTIPSRLVVLNACSTAPGGTHTSFEDHSLARIVIESGASSVLSTLWQVRGDVAVFFAKRLRSLLSEQGSTIPLAYARTLRAASTRWRSELWAPYILTARPRSTAFEPFRRVPPIATP